MGYFRCSTDTILQQYMPWYQAPVVEFPRKFHHMVRSPDLMIEEAGLSILWRFYRGEAVGGSEHSRCTDGCNPHGFGSRIWLDGVWSGLMDEEVNLLNQTPFY